MVVALQTYLKGLKRKLSPWLNLKIRLRAKACSQVTMIIITLKICGALRDLVPLVQFKKREKHP